MNRIEYDSVVPVLEPANGAAGLGQRLKEMAVLWLGLGILVGAALAPPRSGAAGLAAGVIAGTIVLVPVGLVLALIGGRWKGTLFGAAAGQIMGLLIGVVGGWSNPSLLATTGLINGALAGATLSVVLFRLPRLLYSGVLRRAR